MKLFSSSLTYLTISVLLTGSITSLAADSPVSHKKSGAKTSHIYRYNQKEFTGEMSLVEVSENKVHVKIDTVTANIKAATCSLEFDGVLEKPGHISWMDDDSLHKEKTRCKVTVAFTADHADVSTNSIYNCEFYCGMSGDFVGSYLIKK